MSGWKDGIVLAEGKGTMKGNFQVRKERVGEAKWVEGDEAP